MAGALIITVYEFFKCNAALPRPPDNNIAARILSHQLESMVARGSISGSTGHPSWARTDSMPIRTAQIQSQIHKQQ